MKKITQRRRDAESEAVSTGGEMTTLNWERYLRSIPRMGSFVGYLIAVAADQVDVSPVSKPSQKKPTLKTTNPPAVEVARSFSEAYVNRQG